ncbi:copper resistance protein CopC [Thermomicrobium sp. 4228-Ro]|uniref:copper resistance CopC/CopD family protein n=1 Tax=Thermomicrobium sp. 4228-Ro TaxID=2993937 RepID=UPI002248F982|nr:copper resistance protein CopC [Thermomicrobium sp. 4228-Ro]MCX2727711.1 copper resistance protein CopC [Thermomicrobium sp. 4228-Ro]
MSHRTRSFRGRHYLFVLLLVSIGILTLPRQVSAHAELFSADPPPDALLQQFPTILSLSFSEPVDVIGNGIVVLAPSGRPVQLDGTIHFDEQRTTILIPLENSDEEGTYTVRYSVIGVDGHLVSGHYSFSVGSSTQSPGVPRVEPSIVLQSGARLLHLLGLALVLGSVFLALAGGNRVMPSVQRPLRRATRTGAILVSVAAVAQLSALLSLAGSDHLLRTIGALALSRPASLWLLNLFVGLVVFGMATLPVPWRVRGAGSILSAGALVALRVLDGHAVTAPLSALSVTIAAVHTATGAALLGSFVLLPVALREALHGSERSLGRAEEHLRRWFIALFAVSEPLLLSGAYSLWVNVPSPVALGSSWYGRLLLVKLGLLFLLGIPVLLGIRSWFRRRDLPWSLLRLGGFPATITLIVAGALTLLTPARTAVQRAPEKPGLVLAQNAGPYLVEFAIHPASVGINEITVAASAPNGTEVDDAEVTVAVQTAEGPRLVRLERESTTYHGTLTLAAQTWEFAVYVRRAGEESPPALFTIPIPIPDGLTLLRAVDAAMNELRTVEERTHLTSGGPVVETIVRYQAPDRAAYTNTIPGRPSTETIIIDRTRYDRTSGQPWSEQPWPGSQPFRWPTYRYAETAEDVRILGIQAIDGISCYHITFRDRASGFYYQLWVGINDLRIRRYVMMGPGHYMTGEFARFDDPTITIAPPSLSGAASLP